MEDRMDTTEQAKLQWIATVRRLVRPDGTAPSRQEFMAAAGLRSRTFTKHFPRGYLELVQAAGLKPCARNLPIADDRLLSDWGNVVRDLRSLPTQAVYRSHSKGRFDISTFTFRWGRWDSVSHAFLDFAAGNPEWDDVVQIVRSAVAPSPQRSSRPSPQVPRRRPVPVGLAGAQGAVYGDPMNFRGLRHEPVNEQGVVLLFGMLANELGFLVESVQQGFPDCEAKRRISNGRWARVRIEFEFASRNFRDHGHPVEGCDVIVCWRHDWPECPSQIEVLELASVIDRLGD